MYGLGQIQGIVGSDGMKTPAEMSIAQNAGFEMNVPQMGMAFNGASMQGTPEMSVGNTLG